MNVFDAAVSEAATDEIARSRDHGDTHWRSVAAMGAVIAKRSGGSVRMAILFGALHDRYRENDMRDPDHGLRASLAARRLGVIDAMGDLGSSLDVALREHDLGKTSSDVNIGSCWDADRIALLRFGADIDMRFMSVMTISGLADFVPSAMIMITTPPSWGKLREIFEKERSMTHEEETVRQEVISRAAAVGRSEDDVEDSVRDEFLAALEAEGREPREGETGVGYFVEAGYSADNVLQVAGIDDTPHP